MFDLKESKAEGIGRTIGFGIAMLLFVSVFYYILSNFMQVLDLKTYFVVVVFLIVVYGLWAVFKE